MLKSPDRRSASITGSCLRQLTATPLGEQSTFRPLYNNIARNSAWQEMTSKRRTDQQIVLYAQLVLANQRRPLSREVHTSTS